MGLAGGFLTDLRIVLRGRGFRRLFAVRVSGQLGDGVFQVAMASYVFFSPERHATAPAAAQAFAVLLPVRTVGVMGDGRTYDRVLAPRTVPGR